MEHGPWSPTRRPRRGWLRRRRQGTSGHVGHVPGVGPLKEAAPENMPAMSVTEETSQGYVSVKGCGAGDGLVEGGHRRTYSPNIPELAGIMSVTDETSQESDQHGLVSKEPGLGVSYGRTFGRPCRSPTRTVPAPPEMNVSELVASVAQAVPAEEEGESVYRLQAVLRQNISSPYTIVNPSPAAASSPCVSILNRPAPRGWPTCDVGRFLLNESAGAAYASGPEADTYVSSSDMIPEQPC